MTVHFLLEQFKISLKSSLSTQSLCHTISPTVGVKVPQKNKTPNPAWQVIDNKKQQIYEISEAERAAHMTTES